ncbi:MAG TPA: peptide ABC transporter substrate-binding protein [Candidatus Rubrimentiphilum sp.]|nr:peptide ABC transporter substrate-binding protein [Candidatus Rubrimentiphilum sp.]
MKIIRSLAALLAVTVAFSACSKTGTTTTASGRHPWTIPGEVRVGNSDEPDGLNPMFAHTDASNQVGGLIFASLLKYDDNGNFIPDLATEVPSYANGGLSKDGKTITIHMRPGLRWSDGAPLTSKDWMFTYSAVRNPRNNVKTLFGWDGIASASAPNDTTIVIHLKQPNPDIMGLFAVDGAAYPPLPAHILASLPDINRAPFNGTPISSGPFILQQWNHGSSLVFVPNKYYYRGPPHLKKIVWKVIPNGNTLFNELQTHDVDVLIGVNENDIARLPQVPGITVIKKLIANWRHMEFNLHNPILSDQRVRLAIAEAVDWKRINDTIYHGYNQLAVSDVYPLSWAAPNIPPYPYDPDNAKKLLAQAGWAIGPDGWLHKGGQELQLNISTGTNKQENIQAEVQVQSQLKPFGINMAIRNYPVNVLFAPSGPLYTGKYDISWTVSINGPDPDNTGLWNSKYRPPHGGNTSLLNDPIVDRTSELALTTYDQAVRKKYYQQEEERIHQLVPAVFFYWENEYTAVNSDMKNLRPAAFVQDTWNAWDWQI